MKKAVLSFLLVFFGVAASVATTSTCQSDFSGVREANQSIDPTKLEFKLLSSRRFMLTMDRQNFPGMPKPNWTYGGMYLYGANPSSVGGKDAVRDNNRK